MALHALITSQFPRDYLGMVELRARRARGEAERLPEATWDFEWGTNMQHAHDARPQACSPAEAARKQIIMITDGEPTAHIENGEAVLRLPAVAVTIEMTLSEVQRCTKARHPHQHVHARGQLLPA